MGAYDVVFFRGHRFDRMTVAALLVMEKHLGYELSVMQGSYNGRAVGASAGTHAGGGAVDLAPTDAHNKVRVGREFGHFAMWERQPIPGLWAHHVHGILIGNTHASPEAKAQVTDYRNHRNGLKGHAADNTWHPANITPFPYKPASINPLRVDLSQLRIDFVNAAHGQSNHPSAQVKVVQRRLNRLTGSKLKIDGDVGPRTSVAWRNWEKKLGRPANVYPDPYTLIALLKGTPYRMVK